MYKLNKDNFEEFTMKLLPLASSYSSQAHVVSKGFLVNKEENRVFIMTPIFGLDIRDVDINIPYSPAEPFYDLETKSWTKPPYKGNVYEIFEHYIEKSKFIGKTEFRGKEIMRILDKEMEKNINLKTRYIFSQGHEVEGLLKATFKIAGGEPMFSIPGIPIKFAVSENSTIPKEFIQEDITYECSMDNQGDVVYLDVLVKYGKVRSGLIVSDIAFDGRALASVNGFHDIHPELVECSNTLDIIRDEDDKPLTMPPIHILGILLYDILEAFQICKKSNFYLHFQEGLNKWFQLETVSEFVDDPKIFCLAMPIKLDGGFKRG